MDLYLRGGLISGGWGLIIACIFLSTCRWTYILRRGGGLISGGWGLIIGCIFLFTGRWTYILGRELKSGVGAYNRM